MKTTLTLMLRTNIPPSKFGEYPVVIRVSYQGKRKLVSTGKKAHPSQWDELKQSFNKNKPNYAELNYLIHQKKMDMERSLVLGTLEKKDDDVEALLAEQLKHKKTTLLELCEKFIEAHNNKHKPKTIRNYKTIISSLKRSKLEHTPLAKFNSTFLESFEKELRTTISHNSVAIYITCLMAVMNWANREGIMKKSPIFRYKKPKNIPKERSFFSMEEVDTLKKLLFSGKITPHGDELRQTLVWMLFSIYTGLRHIDLRRFNKANLRENEIYLKTQKTGSIISIPINEPLRQLLPYVKNTPTLGITHPIKELTNFKKVLRIAEINRNLGWHSCRHTFGYLCAYLGVRQEIAQKWLGHSDISTTSIYYHITNKSYQDASAMFDTLK